MARSTFGGTAEDVVEAQFSFAGRKLKAAAPNTAVTFWSAATDGTQYTDLLDSTGAATPAITSDADGFLPAFQGPDGITQMWADAGGGRKLMFVQGLAGPAGPPGPGGSDAGVAGYMTTPGTATVAALAANRGTAPGSRWAYFGASNTNGTNNGGEDFSDYATVLSGSRMRWMGKFGYPGFRTDSLLANVPDVLASGCNTVFLGPDVGTNDAGADATAATFLTRYKALVAAFRSAGVSVVGSTVAPRVDKKALIAQYNAVLASYMTKNDIPFVDSHKLLVDTATGGLLAAYDTGDGIHFNGAGHYQVGKEMASKLAPLVPYSEPWLVTDSTDATNLLTNPMFLTDSNSDGQADNWIRSGSATATQTIVTDSRFVGKAQKFAFSSNSSFRSYAQTISTGFAVGDKLGLGFAYAIDNVASVAVGNGFKFQYTWVGPTTLVVPLSGQVNPVSRGVWWNEAIVPTGATGIKYEFVISAGATGVADFFIAQATLRNLTALGIS